MAPFLTVLDIETKPHKRKSANDAGVSQNETKALHTNRNPAAAREHGLSMVYCQASFITLRFPMTKPQSGGAVGRCQTFIGKACLQSSGVNIPEIRHFGPTSGSVFSLPLLYQISLQLVCLKSLDHLLLQLPLFFKTVCRKLTGWLPACCWCGAQRGESTVQTFGRCR